VALAAIMLVGPAGCVRTTIRSGLAPGHVPTGWEGRWHHGFVLGFDELPGPVPVDALCPEGWSQVDTSIDPVQSVLAIMTLGIYTPTTVSVVCAEPNAPPTHGKDGKLGAQSDTATR
jgi:hypothetical protein